MQLDTKVLQSKPPSLEEGPMRCPAYNEHCGFYRVEKRSIYQNCMDIIKVILCLEVIFFIGWIGVIVISNYHLARPYNEEITSRDSPEWMNDFHGNDLAVTSNSISKDDIVTTIKDVDAIATTERTQISTTPEMAVDFANTEESFEKTERPGSNSKTEELYTQFEWPLPIFHIKNVLSNPPLDDANTDIFEKNTNSEKSEIDPAKVKIIFTDAPIPSTLFPKSGLIHVIEDRVSDSNVDSARKSEIPFPLLKVFTDYKFTNEDNLTVEDDDSSDTAEIDSLVKSILGEDFEESMQSSEAVTLKPDITDVSEDRNSYSNVNFNRESEIPFPLPKSVDKFKSTDEENLKDESDSSSDTSEIESLVKSILDEDFEDSMQSSEAIILKPDIPDATEDSNYSDMGETIFNPIFLGDDRSDLGTSPAPESSEQNINFSTDELPSLLLDILFPQRSSSTEDENVVEQDAKSLLKYPTLNDINFTEPDREILEVVPHRTSFY